MEISTRELLNQLFDTIKTKHALKSDAALARHLQVDPMSILRWRRGELPTSLQVIAPLLIIHGKSLQIAPITS